MLHLVGIISLLSMMHGTTNIKYINTSMTNLINYLTNNFRRTFSKNKLAVCLYLWDWKKIIKSLRTKNTYGYDEISNRIIKLTAPFVIAPLTYICNAVIGTGVFPDRLKYAIVNPYPTAFPYGNGMVLHFYQQQESSTTKTVHKVINKGLKAYV